MNGPKSHVVQFPALAKTEDPSLGAAVADTQIQAAAVRVQTLFFDLLNLEWRKPVECPWHVQSISLPIFATPTLADVRRRVQTTAA